MKETKLEIIIYSYLFLFIFGFLSFHLLIFFANAQEIEIEPPQKIATTTPDLGYNNPEPFTLYEYEQKLIPEKDKLLSKYVELYDTCKNK